MVAVDITPADGAVVSPMVGRPEGPEGPAGAVDVALTWTGPDAETVRGVGITIFDSLGEPVFSVGTTSQMDYTTTVPLDPGDYTMNVSAIGYASGNVGPVYDETSTFTVQ